MATRWYDLATAIGLETLPGVDVDEEPIIRAWLRAHEADYDVVAFEVRLGDGHPGFGDDDPAMLRSWAHLTKVRADVVAQGTRSIAVVEAKVHAHVDAVAQLARYATLLRGEPWFNGELVATLICATADAGVAGALATRGFTLETFQGV